VQSFSSLAEWLTWLEQQHPESDIDLGLTRVGEAASRLRLLNPSAKVITIAGTNGKGSCAAALETLLLNAGCSVGVFTSPHFTHYCERIRINGEQASEPDVCQAFQCIANAAAVEPALRLTYFEFGALAALEVFARQSLDVIVLEVGLGGRLDAVNIIDADVAIVTSIAVDHEAWLGSDRETIGREKAGIMRGGKPVVCADYDAPRSIEAYASECGAELYAAGEQWGFDADNQQWQWRHGEKLVASLPLPELPLPSIAAALQALSLLDIEFSSDTLQSLLPTIKLTGRYQKRQCRGRQLVLDVAHNPAAAQLLANKLQADKHTGKTLVVLGMMADKDRVNCFRPLLAEVDRWFTCSLPTIPRAAEAQELAQDLAELGYAVPKSQVCDTVASGLESALAVATQDDRIVVLGSFFTVAEALSALDAGEQAIKLRVQ